MTVYTKADLALASPRPDVLADDISDAEGRPVNRVGGIDRCQHDWFSLRTEDGASHLLARVFASHLRRALC